MSSSSSNSNAGEKFSAPINLQLMRNLFARPDRIVESDFLRREIAGRMYERLSLIKINPQRLLDAGCGPGSDFAMLQNAFPEAQLLGFDASAAMLATARTKYSAAESAMNRMFKRWFPWGSASALNRGPKLICGNFAQLPLPLHAVDLIWSNLALHWHPQPEQVFVEWRRVLKIDGLLMFSCFGPDTFKELRAAFMEIDDPSFRMLPFVDMHDFGDMLVNVGFSTPVIDMEIITVTYDSVDKLIADVRAWGGNPLATRRRGLLGRKAGVRINEALEKGRDRNGRISLTFEVIYGHAFRPAPHMTAKGEAIVRLPLSKR